MFWLGHTMAPHSLNLMDLIDLIIYLYQLTYFIFLLNLKKQ